MNQYARATFHSTPPKPKDDERTTPIPTEEERARVREKLAAFRLQSAEFRRNERKDSKPEPEITEERKEYFRQLMRLPDRGELTEEEKQERRRIEAILKPEE